MSPSSHTVSILVPQGENPESFEVEAGKKLQAWAAKNNARLLERHSASIPSSELVDELVSLEESCPDKEFLRELKAKLGTDKAQSIAFKAFQDLDSKECVAFGRLVLSFAGALEKKYKNKKQQEQPHGSAQDPDFAGQKKFLQFEHSIAAVRYYANWYAAVGESGFSVKSSFDRFANEKAKL